jgi:hypothetical protein
MHRTQLLSHWTDAEWNEPIRKIMHRSIGFIRLQVYVKLYFFSGVFASFKLF